MEKWKQTHGSNATYNNLIGVFKRAGYQGYADTVYKVFGKFIQEIFLSVKGLYLVTILSLLTGDPPTSQAVCGARADPQTSPQKCQECVTEQLPDLDPSSCVHIKSNLPGA